MNVEPSLISELDEALRCSTSTKRVETLRRVTDLFLNQSDALQAEHVTLFDNVLGRMIEQIETRALAELGHRLARVGNAPIGVVRKLAMHDEIAVAGPVLSASSRLTTSDLIGIASAKSQDHLLAIAGRGQIDTPVTDILVGRGNAEVARKVAINEGAKFSSGGFAALLKRAQQDDTLAERVGKRVDIPPQLFKELFEKATAAVKERLKDRLPEALADGALRKLQDIAAEFAPKVSTRSYTAAQFVAKLMHRERRLGDTEICDFAGEQRFEEVVSALAVRTSSQVDVIERLMDGPRIDALLIPCRAAELAWPTVRAIMQLHVSYDLTSEERFGTMRNEYLNLSVRSAQRILRFWQVRLIKEGPAIN